jgi:hypothetical protein
MNCEEVQTRISEYLERSLDAISMKSIEVHLSSCSRCRLDADGLADCIQEVAGLPMVNPPLGFAQRVMAHVREINEKLTLWERLFLPTRVKIPLQASALVLIGALALVLSQKEERLNKQNFPQPATPGVILSAPPAQTSDQQEKSTIAVERSVQENKPAKPTKPFVDLAKQAPELARTSKAAAAPARAEEAQPAAAPPPASAKESKSRPEDKKETPRRRPIPAQEVSNVGDTMRSRSDTFVGETMRHRSDTLGFGLGAGAGTLSQPSLRAGSFLTERSVSPWNEPSADIEFVVVRRRPALLRDQKDAANSVSSQTAESRRTSPAAVSQMRSMTERWFAVPSDRFEEFKKELATEAVIESERTVGVLDHEFAQKIGRELLIKVTILSPAER